MLSLYECEYTCEQLGIVLNSVWEKPFSIWRRRFVKISSVALFSQKLHFIFVSLRLLTFIFLAFMFQVFQGLAETVFINLRSLKKQILVNERASFVPLYLYLWFLIFLMMLSWYELRACFINSAAYLFSGPKVYGSIFENNGTRPDERLRVK